MSTPAGNNSILSYKQLETDLANLRAEDHRFRLVGSLGRAVHYSAALGNPTAEYEARGEHPLYGSTSLRDIDTIGLLTSPDTTFPVDTYAFTHNNQVTVLPDGNDDWWLVSQQRNFAEQLHPDAMQPIEGMTIGNIASVTIPWQTQLALTRARGFPRKKDRLSTNLLQSIADQASLPRLPSEILAPFDRLNEVPIAPHWLAIRALYRSLPTAITRKTTPTLRKLYRKNSHQPVPGDDSHYDDSSNTSSTDIPVVK